ncbi:hypothetical protein [Pseudoalteromonas sp. MER144-MNA-CIBAN-0113]|uniref:hypothetical protein n=1 Tax=Pseudoalteromonas sp. MER144-MNA-CIBAN-0113 TaxID=3140429 RepID=UPI0033302FEF
MALIKQIENLLNSLVEATATLNETLQSAPLINAVCYKLPVETGNHEVENGWQFISLTLLYPIQMWIKKLKAIKIVPEKNQTPQYFTQ